MQSEKNLGNCPGIRKEPVTKHESSKMRATAIHLLTVSLPGHNKPSKLHPANAFRHGACRDDGKALFVVIKCGDFSLRSARWPFLILYIDSGLLIFIYIY